MEQSDAEHRAQLNVAANSVAERMEGMALRVYLVKGPDDEEARFVEASGMGEAIRLYMGAMVKEFGVNSGWDDDGAEPGSVQMVSDEPVVR